MLEAHELYETELAACRATLDPVNWHSSSMFDTELCCTDCGSSLVGQHDPANGHQDDLKLSCRACGADLDTAKVIETALGEALSVEGYLRVKDAGEDGPLFDCPDCGTTTFVDFEGSCAVCGYELTGSGECAVCGEVISLSDRLDDPDAMLCSYHQYVMDKDD
jgi:hypothetical protein